MNSNFRAAADLIEAVGANCAPVLVAVDGRSGAGKSTFAAALATAAQASLVDGDAFYAGGLNVRNDTVQERADACIDRPKLRATLENLKAGRAAIYRPFDWDAFDGSLAALPVIVEPARVIIVEGVYSAHPDFADLLDVRILLSAPDDLRNQRLVVREGSVGPWERQWHEAEEWYFAHLARRDDFDLVID